MPYHSFLFAVPDAGPYNISMLAGFSDPMYFLYANSFNPASPLVNGIASNDDSGPGFWPQILNVNLQAGTAYYLVTTGFSNIDSGAFTNQIDGPVPEPGTWLLVGLGLMSTCAIRWRLNRP